MLVTDRRRTRQPLPELVAAAVAGGVDTVQLREPDLDQATLLALATEARDVIGGRATLLVNRDLAVAARLGTGVHLPEAGPDPATARRQLGADVVIGRSVHAAAAAATTGVDYLLAGHVFATLSKPGQPALGLEGLRRIVDATPIPVLAIGGIRRDTVAATLATGAAGIAVVGAIASAADPRRAAADLRAAVDQAWEQRMEEPGAGMTESGISVTINGKPVALAAGTSITEFITGKGFTAEMVIVELNGEIVPRPDYPSTRLKAGDRLEVVHAVGGG